MPTQDRCNGSCGAIFIWEEAGQSLANALASYQRSCAFLENSYRKGNANPKDLVSRIDSSLKTLHIQIASEMIRSGLILVQMRNEISSRVYSLPKKILAQIFMDVIYAPTSDTEFRSMTSGLSGIYRQLHNLLAVCTTWRNVGIAHKPLWAIIPMVHKGWLGRSKHLAPQLSVDRSSASRYSSAGIHLAALVSIEHKSSMPLVDGRTPKFNTVNVMSKSARAIMHLLDNLAKPRGPWPVYQRLSELSIYQVREKPRRIKGPEEYLDIFYDCVMYSTTGGSRNPLLELFAYLSALRIRGARMLWGQIILSNQLVELRLQSVIFSSDSEILEFFQALNSAPELRDLKIISIIAFLESSSESPAVSQPVKCPVSKLETLLLQDLDFNVLQNLQVSLAPGSYRTTLCLTKKITYIHVRREEPEVVDIKDLCKVLKRISVDKLVLSGDWEEKTWLDHTGLRGILQSLPTVKTLIIEFWNFRKEDLLALERSRPGKRGTKGPAVRFPVLTALYLEHAQMMNAEVLKDVVTSHKLQRMSLRGCVAPAPDNNSDPEIDIDIDTDGSDNAHDFKGALDWNDLESNDKIVKWLKTHVPQFCLGNIPKTETRNYNTSEWQLW